MMIRSVIGALLLAGVVVLVARHWPASDVGRASMGRLVGPAALLAAGNVLLVSNEVAALGLLGVVLMAVGLVLLLRARRAGAIGSSEPR